MEKLVYRNERTLGTTTLVLGVLAWVLLVLGTFGFALLYVLMGFIGYLFAQSALIAYIKGNGVRLSPRQFPDLYERYLECCRKLEIEEPPAVYVLNGGGVLNAFATRFLGRDFVVLLSDIVDALEDHPDGINFYMGHELGHIRMKHLTGHTWRMLVLWLPLLGAAYARAKEYTCDLHGRACCEDPRSAAQALVALAAGAQRWKTANLENFAEQSRLTTGFWASFHELVNGYPWLTKRVRHVIDPDQPKPKRAALAYVFAFFVPYGGRAGGGLVGTFIVFFVVFCLIGALNAAGKGSGTPSLVKEFEKGMSLGLDISARAELSTVWRQAAQARTAVASYYAAHEGIPESLSAAHAPDRLADGSAIALDTDTMALSVRTKHGVFVMAPRLEDDGKVAWNCEAGDGLDEDKLPVFCKASE
jgi:Zn-dependent protease with chaperone function